MLEKFPHKSLSFSTVAALTLNWYSVYATRPVTVYDVMGACTTTFSGSVKAKDRKYCKCMSNTEKIPVLDNVVKSQLLISKQVKEWLI
jgi:hypothetical protein